MSFQSIEWHLVRCALRRFLGAAGVVLLATGLVAGLVGCGTIRATQMTSDPSQERIQAYEGPYMGVVLDVAAVKGCLSQNPDYEPRESLRAVPFLDIPFSFILDTLMLPYTLWPPYYFDAIERDCE